MTRATSAEKDRKSDEGGATAVTLELLIECGDETVAAALNDALTPDNRYFPKDQEFQASRRGHSLVFEVRSPRGRPAVSTVSGIISDAALFRDVWLEAKTKGLGAASQ